MTHRDTLTSPVPPDDCRKPLTMTKQTLMSINVGVAAFAGLFGIAAAANGRTLVAWCAAGLFTLAALEIAYCLPGRRRSA